MAEVGALLFIRLLGRGERSGRFEWGRGVWVESHSVLPVQ